MSATTASAVSKSRRATKTKNLSTGNKILTCETWVTKPDWWAYAKAHPEFVPFPLVDRSPCQEPFLDPYGAPGARQVVVSGLCRLLKNFNEGERLIYVTRVAPEVARELALPERATGAVYLGIASVTVGEVIDNHAEAARRFSPRRYIVAPGETPYPPNLAHDPTPVAAVVREACILSLLEREDGKPGRDQRTPDRVTPAHFERHYTEYHERERDRKLRAALCTVDSVNGHECLVFDPHKAPAFSADDWGGVQMNVQGLKIDQQTADYLCAQIADAGSTLS